VKGGKLRLLSISGESRNKNFPEVPALNELVPGVVGGAWFGISAPAKLPTPIANRLQSEIQSIVNAPEMLVRLTEMGMTPMPLTGQDFINFLQAENRRWGPVIRAGKITVE
jgi:tripartite-type tricarboxylate transporter receptor subunit TctC